MDALYIAAFIGLLVGIGARYFTGGGTYDELRAFGDHPDKFGDGFHPRINPASGLPMVSRSMDTAGNAYGTSGLEH